MAVTKEAGISNFYKGDTRKYKVVLTDDETGDPISVDGGTLFITFKTQKADEDADALISESFPATEPDPQNPTGEIFATLTASNTDIPAGFYYYDFQFVSGTGEVTTILPSEDMESRVRILEDITNRVS